MIDKDDVNSQIYLQTILRKSLGDISQTDLEKVKSFSFNGQRYDGSENKNDYEVVKLFPNLEEVCIEKIYISNDIMNKILENKGVSFLIIVKCAFYDDFDFSVLKNIKGIKLLDCYIDDYKKLFSNLQVNKLVIQRQQDNGIIDIDDINHYEGIKVLKIEECQIKNVDKINKFDNCEELSLLWSKFKISKNVFRNMKSLKTLYIDREYNKLLSDLSVELKNNYVNELFLNYNTKI